MKSHAWKELSSSEENEIWSIVKKRLGFRPSVYENDFPGFKEPTPSITYSFQEIWDQDPVALEANLQENAHAMFKMATPAGTSIYALDWQHQCYKFYPGSAKQDEWIIPVLPDGDYYIFIEKSLAFGWLGHPWEQTICIFGKPLLNALKNNRPKVFKDPIRRRD